MLQTYMHSAIALGEKGPTRASLRDLAVAELTLAVGLSLYARKLPRSKVPIRSPKLCASSKWFLAAGSALGAAVVVATEGSADKVVGGHLLRGSMVHTTAEVVLCVLTEVEFHRTFDPATGFKELEVVARTSAPRLL